MISFILNEFITNFNLLSVDLKKKTTPRALETVKIGKALRFHEVVGGDASSRKLSRRKWRYVNVEDVGMAMGQVCNGFR